jgi:MFS family permease
MELEAPRGAFRQLGGAGIELVALAGLAIFFVSLDSSALVLALPAIERDFQASVAALSGMGSVLTLGGLAAFPLGMLADRAGRRLLLILGLIGFSLANLASAAATNLAFLASMRLVASCFEVMTSAVATALVVEMVPAQLRGRCVAALTVAAGLGTGLTAVLWPLLSPNWRPLYLLGASGIVAAVLLAWRLPESGLWAAASHERMPFEVLLSGQWRKRLAIMLGFQALAALFYAPAGLFVVLYGSDLGLSPALLSLSILVSGILSLPAFAAGGRLSDRWGRRPPGVLLSLVAVLGAALSFSGHLPAYWAGNIVWSIFASAAAPVFGAWYGELFPTRARATSEAAAAGATAVGGVAGLQLTQTLSSGLGLGRGLLVCALAGLAASLLLLLLPETRAQPLPD